MSSDLKTRIRQCLLYEFQQGHSAADATRNVCARIAPEVVSHSTAKYWFSRFRDGDFSLDDRPRSGRPSTLDADRLTAIIQSDPSQTTRSLAEQLDCSHSTVERHLHDQGLNFRDGRWIYVGTGEQDVGQSSSPVHKKYSFRDGRWVYVGTGEQDMGETSSSVQRNPYLEMGESSNAYNAQQSSSDPANYGHGYPQHPHQPQQPPPHQQHHPHHQRHPHQGHHNGY